MIDGREVRGEYEGVDAAAGLRVQGAAGIETIGTDELSRVVLADPAPVAMAAAGPVLLFLLPEGRMSGRIVGQVDGGIEVQTGIGKNIVLSFDDLAAIRFTETGSDDGRGTEVFEAELARRMPGKDVLIARSGDEVRTVQGLLLELGPARGRFSFKERERSFALAGLEGIVLAAAGAADRDGLQPADRDAEGAAGPPVVVELLDGTRLPGRLAPCSGERLAVAATFGERIDLPIDTVARIEFRSDRIVYLSDLEPVRQESAGLLHRPWPMRLDRSVANRPIVLGGRRYERGLGVHARTELAYRLDEAFALFVATVGIDDSVRPRGNVTFKVLGDGRVLYDNGAVGGRDEPQSVRADVSGVAELTLLVDYGDEMDLADHADWGGARLIRAARGG
ncbi:MAG: hypothetical protein GY778_01995 [bacterium]|nr:hypothetical protein [bacterium]